MEETTEKTLEDTMTGTLEEILAAAAVETEATPGTTTVATTEETLAIMMDIAEEITATTSPLLPTARLPTVAALSTR